MLLEFCYAPPSTFLIDFSCSFWYCKCKLSPIGRVRTVTEGRGPEEFFEVFRSVQSNRKKRDEKAPSAGTPTDEPETEAAPPAAEPEPRLAPSPRVWERELTVSVPVAALVVLGALLVVAAAYMLGRQHGWQSHAGTQAQRSSTAGQGSAPTTALRAASILASEPEYNAEGKVFTLVTYGTGTKDRDRAEQEAKYLNSYSLFSRTLKVQAYVWRDTKSKYRLCGRGLSALSPANADNVVKEIKKLKSSHGRPDYATANFEAP